MLQMKLSFIPFGIWCFLISNLYLAVFLCAGCAFLKYETKEQALAALEAINGKHTMEVGVC